MPMNLKQWILDAADVVFPRQCAVCGRVLGSDEHHVCRACMASMPVTGYHLVDFNPFEQLAEGRVPIEHATAYFFYDKQSPYVRIIHDAKYRNMPKIGRYIAAHAAREIQPSGFFNGIDLIVPVPIHFSKRASRGYNQTEYIARGISDITRIPVINAVRAAHAHNTQTNLNAQQRLKNAQHIYDIHPRHAGQLRHRHVLLVDDVVTTGATLLACAEALRAVEGVTVSLFTLAIAHHN